MPEVTEDVSGSSGSAASGSPAVLARFLASNPGAQRAARSLRSGAEVAIMFTDAPDPWRAVVGESGALTLEPGAAADPDFELHVPPQALHEVCASDAQDLGDLGVSFFEHMVAHEPERRIHAQVHSGVVKLTRRGWVGLLALGGPKVMMWMARKGLRGPGAVAGALGRFKAK